MAIEKQEEGKTERLTVACTRTERRLVELVVTVDEVSTSEMLRVMSLEAVLERGQVIAERLRGEMAVA